MTERLSVTLTREYDAPIELVYSAWTDAAQVVRWMKCEASVRLSYDGWDPKPGARFTSVMEKPGEWKVEGAGKFVEVDPPRVLEYASEANESMHMPEMSVRVVLEELEGGRTKLTLTHSGIPNDETCAIIDGGWTSSLQMLEGVVAAMA